MLEEIYLLLVPKENEVIGFPRIKMVSLLTIFRCLHNPCWTFNFPNSGIRIENLKLISFHEGNRLADESQSFDLLCYTKSNMVKVFYLFFVYLVVVKIGVVKVK